MRLQKTELQEIEDAYNSILNKKAEEASKNEENKEEKKVLQEEMDPHSREAVDQRFNKRLQLAKAAGVEFLKQLSDIKRDTWDDALPQGFSENLINDIVKHSIGEMNMADDIKAHFVRVIQDVTA